MESNSLLATLQDLEVALHQLGVRGDRARRESPGKRQSARARPGVPYEKRDAAAGDHADCA